MQPGDASTNLNTLRDGTGVELPPQCEISRTITPSTIGGYFRSMAPRSMEVSKVLFISRDVDTIALYANTV